MGSHGARSDIGYPYSWFQIPSGYDIHSSPWFFDGPNRFIDGLPINSHGDFPWRTVSHNQMVCLISLISHLFQLGMIETLDPWCFFIDWTGVCHGVPWFFLSQHQSQQSIMVGFQVGFAKMRGLAMDGNCKTFDSSADGFARGEGMGRPLRCWGSGQKPLGYHR